MRTDCIVIEKDGFLNPAQPGRLGARSGGGKLRLEGKSTEYFDREAYHSVEQQRLRHPIPTTKACTIRMKGAG